ncbi:MAG: glycosyltransferase family 2 protein [Candidatus Pacebacteria bacterium]|jgi:GT2 family glycosyltransferase|nr:glycosyltransferase family 2 protein [Candidatus Paceibacterota bacterium]
MSKSNIRVFILSAVHNDLTYTKKFLKSINNQTYSSMEIIIVDDGSSDGTKEFINDKYPIVKLLIDDGNLWWTGSLVKGINNILQTAKHNDYILTINSDCEVKRDFVTNLVNSASGHPLSIIGSTIIDIKTKKIADAGVTIDWKTGKFSQKLPAGDTRYISSEFLSTKGVIFPIQVFKKIGNFNHKQLPHYLSDYEFSCRARKAGYRLLVDTKSIVYNYINRTGMGNKIPPVISLKEFIDLLFSRKSRQNIIDHFHFIKTCCPRKFKLKNYLIILIKTFYLLTNIGLVGKLTIPIKKLFTNKSF